MKNNIKTSKAVYFDDAAIKHRYLAEKSSSKALNQAISTEEREADFKIKMKLSVLTSTFMDINIGECELLIKSRSPFSFDKNKPKNQQSYKVPEFMRLVELPNDIDPHSMNHQVKEGILTISFKRRGYPTSDLPGSMFG